jgi:hypothetical protein
LLRLRRALSRLGTIGVRLARAPRACAWACVLLVGVLSDVPAAAAPFDGKGDDWEGISQFLHVAEVELGASRVALTSSLDLHQLDPADALVLVHPTRALDVDGLAAFIRAGGRIIALDEHGTGDELFARFGIRRRPMPRRPAEMLRGNPALAIAEPGAAHPAVLDVSRVVTNHATGLEQPDLAPVLVVHGDGEDDVVLALAGNVGRGRLLAIGDASVLINAMLRYPGNRSLALALVRFAVADDSRGTRGGKLYVLANDFETTGSFGSTSAFAESASEAQHAIARSLETAGLTTPEGVAPLAAYLTALAIGVGIIVWTGVHAGKTHKLVTPRFARGVPVVAHGGIAGHAAVLGAPGTSRALAVAELKSALEEELATKLGLQRAPSSDQLVAALRRAHLLDDKGARALSLLLASMARAAAKLARPAPGAAILRGSPSDGDVLTIAAEVRALRRRLNLGPIAGKDGRGTVGESQ